MLEINVKAIREDTPACQNIIHFNNAGSSLMPTPVYKILTDYLALEQRIGGYEAFEARQTDFDAFYSTVARLLNVDPQEIAYLENASRAWAMAVSAIPFTVGDRLLIHESEYSSNYLMLLQLVKTKGIIIDFIPSDAAGQIDIDALRGKITTTTKAIAITHISVQGSGINPVLEVGAICREYDLIYILDACQSVGQMPIDVQKIGCDILAASGRKYLRGPRGTGFLYVSKRILADLTPAFVDLHTVSWPTAERYELNPTTLRFETWERFMAGQLGLAAAAEYACAIGLDAIQNRIKMLATYLEQHLAEIPGVHIHAQGLGCSGIVTFTKDARECKELVQILRQKNINTSSLSLEHVRLDFERQGTTSLVRSSIHYFNTKEEISHFCRVISSI